MKNLFYNILALLMVAVLGVSCQQEEVGVPRHKGSVSFQVTTLTSTNSRALDPSTYNPKQIALIIKDDSGNTVKQTDDHTEWKDLSIELPVGSYTVTASSNGFDGNESGFDIPYYAGSKSFTVADNTLQTVSITCTLATVKVSVSFSDRFKAAFQSAKVRISSSVSGISPLEFVMGGPTEGKSAYFPKGDLTSMISVTSAKGSFSSSKVFENAQPRDHYILTYDVNASGSTNITVSASEAGNTYTYDINVSDFSQVLLETSDLSEQGDKATDVWSTKAMLSGSLTGIEEFDISKATFEYRMQDADSYETVPALEAITRAATDVHNLYAEVTGLSGATSYVYRLVYNDGEDIYASKERSFLTEEQTALPHGNLDSWYTTSKVAYPVSSQEYSASGSWWDSSNKGTSTISSSNTTGVSDSIHTAGGMAAKLASVEVNAIIIRKFAAASLYAGSYQKTSGTKGAVLDWGRPFTSRPKALRGWYNYVPGTVTHLGTGTPDDAGFTVGSSTDLCSAYIALVKVDNPNSNGTAFSVDNTNMSTFPDWKTDPRVIAYAELPKSESGLTNGWKKFELELEYYKTDVKPTHIIIVFSSSRYGDYFTGSKTSVMYLDDLELVY